MVCVSACAFDLKVHEEAEESRGVSLLGTQRVCLVNVVFTAAGEAVCVYCVCVCSAYLRHT